MAGAFGLRFGRFLASAGVGVALAMAGGCAIIERAAVEESKQQVAERAQERWDFLMKGQVERAYEYFSPTSRETLGLEAFKRRSGTTRLWRRTQLEKVDCQADACKVTMTLEYDMREFKGLKTTVEEAWVKDSGTWWLVAPRR